MFNENFDFVIPLGFNCNTANALKLADKRHFKLPFDWMAIRNNNNPETYLKMIDDALNKSLDLNIIRENTPEKTYTITKYNAWIPHEPEEHDIEMIRLNYEKYFNRLITILQCGTIEKKQKILILISNYFNHNNDIRIIDLYKNYLENKFPNNIYYFFTVNLGINEIRTDYWINSIIEVQSCWKIIDGVNVCTDNYLETLINLYKENITITNKIDIEM